MSIVKYFAAISLIVGLVGCTPNQTKQVQTNGVNSSYNVVVGSTPLQVEVADSDVERQQGLSGRDGLPENGGMLFVFEEPGRYEFWMKDMLFALDFLWVAQGKVTEVTANVPPPTPEKPDPVHLRPREAVTAVIEVPAGWAAAHVVVIGAEVSGLP